LMDPATTTNTVNYGFGAGTQVTAASLDPDGHAVTLNVQGLGSARQYSLALSGVKDLAGNSIVSINLKGTLQIDDALTGTASQSSDIDNIHSRAWL